MSITSISRENMLSKSVDSISPTVSDNLGCSRWAPEEEGWGESETSKTQGKHIFHAKTGGGEKKR